MSKGKNGKGKTEEQGKVKLTSLKLSPNNPRFIRDDRFDALMKSISDFPKMMELRPIIVDEENVILGGNMRYRALKKLGISELLQEWVKKAGELTDEEKKKFQIKDNVGFGEWECLVPSRWSSS